MIRAIVLARSNMMYSDEAKGSAGQLAATNEHLKDMRHAFWKQYRLILSQVIVETEKKRK